MTFRPTLWAFGLGAIAAVVSASASAEGNAERGRILANTCQGCHGVPNYKNASPNYRVPKLGGQHPKYIEAALREYAAGERPHPTMHAQASTQTDQDRADIAAYLQGKPLQPNTEVVGTPPPATQTCVACHGVDGAKTVADDYPILAGQYADYLVQALNDYKAGKRKNAVMAGIIAGVKPQDFKALAEFFSKQGGLCGMDTVYEYGKCQ
jgi:cytochrome c553